MSRILVPIDGSEPSLSAVRVAADLGRRIGAEVDLIHVWQPALPIPLFPVVATPDATAQQEDFARSTAEALAAQAREILVASQVMGGQDVFEIGDPGRQIVKVAASGKYDAIVMGTHGKGLRRFFVGSVAEYVLRHAPCPLMTVRGHQLPAGTEDVTFR